MALSRMWRQYERSEQQATCAELIEYNHAAVTTATAAIAADAADGVVMVSVRPHLCVRRGYISCRRIGATSLTQIPRYFPDVSYKACTVVGRSHYMSEYTHTVQFLSKSLNPSKIIYHAD